MLKRDDTDRTKLAAPLSKGDVNRLLAVVALMMLGAVLLALAAVVMLPARWRERAQAEDYLQQVTPQPPQNLIGGGAWDDPDRSVFARSESGGERFSAAQRDLEAATRRVWTGYAAAAGAVAVTIAVIATVQSTSRQMQRK